MQALIKEVRRSHTPNPPASLEDVERFERANGWGLDRELREFYLASNGAELFGPFPKNSYRILSLSEIVRVRKLISGEDADSRGPRSWYALCDMQDGDYVAVDVDAAVNGLYPLRDCFHETFPELEYSRIVAPSFSKFLEQALRSGGKAFWL